MARYTGPVCRLCRREGMKLYLKGERCLTKKCAIERRPTPPGPHGSRRRKPTEYGIRLREKQKTRRIYGVLERQFRKHYEEAERRPGMTGENLLQILELRLDNVVYRLGYADSRSQARQLVTHGHFAVNGRKTDIPSAQVKIGDMVSLTEHARKLEYFHDITQVLLRKNVPGWLAADPSALEAKVMGLPIRDDIDTQVTEQLVVEYYSR